MVTRYRAGAARWARVLCVLVGALAIAALVAQAAIAGQAPVSITMFHHFIPEESRGALFRQLVAEFNDTHAGQFRVDLSFFADWMPLQQKIRTMVAAGDPPDLFYYNFNPNDLAMQRSGKLLDFGPYMDAQWRSRFFDRDLASLTVDGHLVSIPFGAGPVFIYYNKKLFRRAGMEGVPATWDEFFAVAQKLKGMGVAAVSLFTSDDAWHATNFLSAFAAGMAGEEAYSKPGAMNAAVMEEAARLLARLFAYTTPDAVGGKWAVSVQNFLTGRTAMLLDGPWVIGMIESEMEDPDEVGVAHLPRFRATDPQLGLTDTLTVLAAGADLSPAQREAAVAFVKYLTSEPVSKRFAIEGKWILATRMEFTPEEKARAGRLMAANVDLMGGVDRAAVQMVRLLTPSAQSELPRLIEGLALGRMSARDFVQALQATNR